MPRCTKCGAEKHMDQFPVDPQRPSGRHPYCRICKAAEQREREHAKTKNRQAVGRPCRDCGNRCAPAVDGTNKAVLCPACRENARRKEREQSRMRMVTAYPYRSRAWKLQQGIKQTLRKQAAKERWIQQRGGKCNVCGLTVSNQWPAACFDFHHKEGEDKEHNIATLFRSPRKSKKTIERELKKCVVLCSNCHRRLHFTSILKQKRKELKAHVSRNTGSR